MTSAAGFGAPENSGPKRTSVTGPRSANPQGLGLRSGHPPRRATSIEVGMATNILPGEATREGGHTGDETIRQSGGFAQVDGGRGWERVGEDGERARGAA